MDPRLYSNRRRANTLKANTYDKIVEKNLNEQKENELEKKKALNEALYSVGFRGRNRIAKERTVEAIRNHNETYALKGLTEALFLVAKDALLLNENYLSAKLPTYEADMKDTIAKFLAEGAINQEITDPDAKALCEAVVRNIPDYNESLTEEVENSTNIKYILDDEIHNTKELNKSLSSLSGDVTKRVAELVNKNQLANDELQNDIDTANSINEARNAKAAAEMPVEEPVEVPEEEMPVEEQPVEEEMPEVAEEAPLEDPDAPAPEVIEVPAEGKETKLELDPKGGIKISIKEEIANSSYHTLTESDKKLCAASYLSLYAPLFEAAGNLEEVEEKLNDKPEEKDSIRGWLYADKAGSVLLKLIDHKDSENLDIELVKKVSNDEDAMKVVESIRTELDKDELDSKKVEELHDKFAEMVEKLSEIKEDVNKKDDDVIENLAMNEGYRQLRDNKDFDPDAAVAGAIVYATVLETLDRTGFVTIGKQGYRNILEACKRNRKHDQIKVRSKKFDDEQKALAEEAARKESVRNVLRKGINTSLMANPAHMRSDIEEPKRMSKAEMLDKVSESKLGIIHESYYMMNGNKYSENEMNQFLFSQGFSNGLRESDDALKNYFGITKVEK